MHYEIASITLKGRKKESFEKNGDYFLTLENEHCVVLTLADGVGSCADDHRASHTLCERFIEKCKETLAKALPLNDETLIRFCREIDPVLSVDNDMACFCSVVCYKTEDKCTFIHVGDTRIYLHSIQEGLRQVTKDDHGKAVNIKIGGKLYTDHGAVVSAVPIDKAVGDGGCEYNTGLIPFGEGDSLILCSDGMYGSSTFQNDLDALLKKASIADSIHGFTTTDDDDATLLILRREANDDIKASLQDIMLHFDDYKDILPYSLANKFVSDLLPMLKPDADTDELQAVVDFMKAHSLYPEKKRMEQLFNTAFNAYKSLPEGNQKQHFNEVCCKLKEMLKEVFKPR
jgi:serine/threonine protein phosphatase PrpC